MPPTLNFWILGDIPVSFAVNAAFSEESTIHDLIREIKKEAKPVLNHVAHNEFVLWKVSILSTISAVNVQQPYAALRACTRT